ncbi:hypothetical protein [Inhella gelatinilytica]|uniref:Uncharacterized protein n=1 Tax=Inhella gelatinilytica TaxID=2795030 RepID=A0A931IVF4_9BURK|nr:hypothetical protein [Inhella gelatinilytica]MBH9552281.1 hypothetical protein [Inhella gelatinilytica]
MRTIAPVLLKRLHAPTRPKGVVFGRQPSLLARALWLSALLHVWLALSVGLRTGPADPARSGRGGPLVMVLEGWGTAPRGRAETEVPEVLPDGPTGTAATPRHGGVVRPAVEVAADTPGARRQGRWRPQEVRPDPDRAEGDGGGRGEGPAPRPAPALSAQPPAPPVPPPEAPGPEPRRLGGPVTPQRTAPPETAPAVPRLAVPEPSAQVEPQSAKPEVPPPVPAPEPEAVPAVEPVLRVLTPDAPQVRERPLGVERAGGGVAPTLLDAQALAEQLAHMRQRLAVTEAQTAQREAAAQAAASAAAAASATPAASAPTPAVPRWLEAPAEPRPRSAVERLRALSLPPARATALSPPPTLPPEPNEAVSEPEPVLRTLNDPAVTPLRPVLETLRQPRLEALPTARPSPALSPAVPRLETPPEVAPAPVLASPVPSAAPPAVAAPSPAGVPPAPVGGPVPQTPAALAPGGAALSRGDPQPSQDPGPRATAGGPDAGPRVGHDVATAPSAAASAPPPPLNLSLPRSSAAGPRRSPGLLELLPALPPERKNKMEKAVEDAQREDCRKAHQEKGLLALGPMALEALRNKGCKW